MVILPSILLMGCVVVGPVRSSFDTTDIESSAVYKCGLEKNMALNGCRAQEKIGDASSVVMCPSAQSGVLTSCKLEEAHALTETNFIAVWGEPKARGTKDRLEYLIYNKNIAWRGLFMIFVILPMPLMAPAGHNETILFFENGRLTRTMVEYGDWNASGAFL